MFHLFINYFYITNEIYLRKLEEKVSTYQVCISNFLGDTTKIKIEISEEKKYIYKANRNCEIRDIKNPRSS